MYDRLTDRAKMVIKIAKEEAAKAGSSHASTEHILLGLISERDGMGAIALPNMGVKLDILRSETLKLIQNEGGSPYTTSVSLSPSGKRVVEFASQESQAFGTNFIGTEHLLLGLIRESEGVAARILAEMGVDLVKARNEIHRLTGGSAKLAESPAKATAARTPALDAFGSDLTALAREDKLLPMVGRNAEIDRIVLLLRRTTRSNVLLIGEFGVGRTTIVEGLARRFVRGGVPDLPPEARVVALDRFALAAGSGSASRDGERLRAVVNEVRGREELLLYLLDIHAFMEADAQAGGLLLAALVQEEAQCIGAITPVAYRRAVADESLWLRYFQPVWIEPQLPGELREILGVRCEGLERFHHVRYTEAALEDAADAAALPLAALDLLDEAGAMAYLREARPPQRIGDMERELAQANADIEAAAVWHEYERCVELKEKRDALKECLEREREAWQASRLDYEVTADDIVEIVRARGRSASDKPES